jgi:drug/metabolite transporter (DMT)-like permease
VALLSVSSTALVIRHVDSIPALTLAFWRMFLASIFLWFYSSFRAQGSLSKQNKKRILIAGVSLGLHFAFFFIGVRNTTISNATLFATTGPFFTTLFALLKGEKFKVKVYWGLSLSSLGFFVVQRNSLSVDPAFFYGNILSLLSGLCIAVTYIYASKIRKKTSNTVYGRTLFFIAAITIGLLTPLTGDSLLEFKLNQVVWLVFLGFVPSILGHNLLNYSIKFLSPTAVASVPLGEPLIASVFGYIIFSETIPKEAYIGGLIILIGIFFIIRGHNRD